MDIVPQATDRERLMALLVDFGIAFKEKAIEPLDADYPINFSKIVLEAEVLSACPGKVRGYDGFYTEFTFEASGKFVEAGLWE